MSGHSHWATIRRSKAANDNKRGRDWSKVAKRIIVAAKSGGGSPDENLSLRYAIDDAKAANMPKDTIKKAIMKGTGELAGESYEEMTYEGYGSGGVAFLVECLTDNRNRTAPEMRKLFERAGGQLGSTNCVAWMFEKKGTFVIAADQADEETLMNIALDAGADDVSAASDFFEVTCHPTAFLTVKQALEAKSIQTISAELAMIPKTTVRVEADHARQVLRLMEALEEHDDVQKVYANFDMPDEIYAEAQKA
jgi:YebC/PmpR family DNA-binding regulatory protein